MHRFYLPPAECNSDSLTLTGREAHHAARVLRLRRGDAVTVLDGAGSEMVCSVVDSGHDTLRLAVKTRVSIPPPNFQITLLQAVPKGKLLESIIQKAVELGAHRVVPLLTERVVTRLAAGQSKEKAGKLQQIAIEALKQSGASWLPTIEPPSTASEVLTRGVEFELSLIASLQPDARHAREWFQQFYASHHRKPKTVGIWIGPEGDFTADEVRAVQAGGALPITLGRLVLRVETAATSCLAILNHELQAPDDWSVPG